MAMPGFSAEASLQKMTNHRQLTGHLPQLKAVYPAQGNGVGTILGEDIDPVSWYAVHPPKYGVVHPGQTDAFVACVAQCVKATGDYAACQRGCCKQFTHYSACVIP